MIDRVEAEDLPFPDAVQGRRHDRAALRRARRCPRCCAAVEEAGLDVFAIVEQDMYPCPPDQPLPIAQRTHTYLGSCGTGSVRIGTPA